MVERAARERLQASAEQAAMREQELQSLKQRTETLRALREDIPGSVRTTLPARVGKGDSHPWLLGTRQGVLDLRTGTLRPGQPPDHPRTTIPTAWKSLDEPAPRFEQFLRDLFGGREEAEREELIAFLQRVLGYGITGNVHERVFLMLYGAQENHSAEIVMQLLEHVLGKLVGALPGNLLASNAFSASSLQGKRIVWAREPNSEACLPVEQIKLLTAGETLTTRQLYSREQHFTPTHLLILLTSLSPENRLMDNVFRERLCLLALNSPATDSQAAADERQADSTLKAALEAEASGILAWLVRGTREWMRLGLAIPASARQTAPQHLHPQSSVQDFIHQCCVLEAEARTSAHQLYKRYKHWASQQHRTPLSNKQFGHALKHMSEITSQRGKRGAVYAGIRLTKENEGAGENTP